MAKEYKINKVKDVLQEKVAGKIDVASKQMKIDGLMKFTAFFSVGVASTLVDWAVYSGLVLFAVPYLIALTISYTSGMIVNFTLNRKYTFQKEDKTSIRFATFVFLALCMLGVSTVLLKVLVDQGWNKILARMLVTVVVFVVNFVVHKNITFR